MLLEVALYLEILLPVLQKYCTVYVCGTS